jgi:probable FeS assembly SUF system protein SufT
MAHRMEEVSFGRDTTVVLIPDGYSQELPEGTRGWVTQVLGGNFTVQLETGRLVRVAAEDADAIGREAEVVAAEFDPNATVEEDDVWDQLRTCYDPEIPLDIVELGLVYGLELSPDEEGGTAVAVTMTLTAPGCGMGQVLADDVQRKVESLPGVRRASVELTFDPPWSPERMSEEGRLELGMFW